MKRILRVLTCSGGFGKKEKEADQPEECKIEKSAETAVASPIDEIAASEVAAENGEDKSTNSSFEIIETNDPALVENKEENKTENDATEALEAKDEEKSSPVFKNLANTIEEKPAPVAEPAQEIETAPVPADEAPVAAEKVEAQTQAEPEVVKSSACPAELAKEAADLQKMTVAEEKNSIAEEIKTQPKEEPLNFAKALKTPPVEEKIVEKTEEKIVEENVKLEDLEIEEDSGIASEEKSPVESVEKIQAISDECEKAVKRTSTEIEALRAEILRNILIAKELENEKEEKLDIPAEAPVTSQTTNANKTTPNKKSKKRKHKVQKPKHQKW